MEYSYSFFEQIITYHRKMGFFFWSIIWTIRRIRTKTEFLMKKYKGFLRFWEAIFGGNFWCRSNNSLRIVIFYTEILTGKFVLWCFFLEWNEWKNPQFNFSSQNLSIECNFFKWDGKETKILHLLFHRIWKKYSMNYMYN